MQVFAQAFWLPKHGNSNNEYEDAYYPEDLSTEKRLHVERGCIRFAVADGATETSFSGLWARLLTRAYGRGRLEADPISRRLHPLHPIRRRWRSRVAKKPLPWYAEEKLKMGAFSSILGLSLKHSEGDRDTGGGWEAFALGDSCLFHVRDGKLLFHFPLQHAADFNSRPWLLSTEPIYDSRLPEAIRTDAGTWQSGDHFFLITDALAHWFLKEYETGGRPWDVLQQIGMSEDPSAFSRWIHDLRATRRLRNDDVTLVWVETS